MASETQSKYIADLAVLKTKEFKEVKELLIANQIIGADAEIVKTATTIAEITHALTDLQASKLIDVLIQTTEPKRGTVYSPKRINRATGELEHIKAIINGWDFGDRDYATLIKTIQPAVESAIATINNPEIAPEVRQRNQEILLKAVGQAIYEKVYDMNAFDYELDNTRGIGIDNRYFGLAKVISGSISTADKESA